MITRLKDRLETWLWTDPSGNPWRRRVVPVMRLLYALARDLVEGQLSLHAMSLVYTTLLSFVPLLAITFSVLKGFGVHNQIEPFLRGLLAPLGAQGEEIATRIIGFVDNMQVGVLGSVGLAMLIYTVISLLQKIEHTFNVIWQVSHDRSLSERFSGYFSVLLIAPVLVFSSLGLTTTVSHSSVVQQMLDVPGFGFLLRFLGLLVPYAMIILGFTLIYILMPNTKVRWTSALIGGVVAGVLWETVGWAFAAYVVASSNYPAIYSAFATLLLFMIWLYVAWLILLAGASVAFYHQHPECIVAKHEDLRLSLGQQERLALALAAAIVGAFQKGRPPPTATELALDYNVPTGIACATLDALETAGILTRAHGNKGQANGTGGYLPARAPETVTAADVVATLRAAGRGGAGLRAALTGHSEVERTIAEAEAAARRALSRISLKDLAETGGIEASRARGP